MPRNRVQFQKGLSESTFQARYGTAEQCRELLKASRWPDGFVCPVCGHTKGCQLHTRALYQCACCHAQTLLTVGTIMDNCLQ